MIRIMTGGGRRWGVPTKEEQDIRSKATDRLLRDHVASPKLGPKQAKSVVNANGNP
jgi:hypothetical protein